MTQTTPAQNSPASESSVRRVRYLFGGECQGVGFRWNTQRIASELHMTGWVKNEVDGTVTAELQGTSQQLSQFHGALATTYKRWHVGYQLLDAQDVEVIQDEADFRVRY